MGWICVHSFALLTRHSLDFPGVSLFYLPGSHLTYLVLTINTWHSPALSDLCTYLVFACFTFVCSVTLFSQRSNILPGPNMLSTSLTWHSHYLFTYLTLILSILLTWLSDSHLYLRSTHIIKFTYRNFTLSTLLTVSFDNEVSCDAITYGL